MAVYRKSQADLRIELKEQLQALGDSARAYDAGKLWEAKRLATTIYILVHDGGRNSRSLLTQLEMRKAINFLSTTKPPEIGSPLPLASISIDVPAGTSTYKPFLEAESTHRKWLQFSKWYKEPVFQIGDEKRLSRKNLIYAMRNQMGGGHVDGEIKEETMQWLTRGAHVIEAGDWQDESGNAVAKVPFAEDFKGGSVPNGHFATMRQIAWEIEISFMKAGLQPPR